MDLSKVRGKWEDVRKALPTIFDSYEDELEQAPSRLSIAGKTGPEAQKEQCAWPVYYGMKKAEIGKLLRYMDARVEEVRSQLYKRYNEKHSRQLGERQIDKYINSEEEYLRIHELYLEVQELYDKFSAVCDAFDRRGFALRDWTAIRVEQLQDVTI